MGGVLKEDDDDIHGGDDQENVVIVETDEADGDDGGDDRLVSTADDGNEGERESIRERRRQEKLDRKERREGAIKRDKLELDFLRKRNDDLERRVSAQEQRAHQSDLNGLDAAIQKAASDAQLAERVIAKAVESGNGEDVTQAMRYRDQSMTRLQQLNQMKQQAAQRPAPGPQLDDMAMHHAKEFLKSNPWYDAQGRDEESAIVLAIDNALSKDGYNPQSEEYWDELRNRAARRLPERFGKDAPRAAPRTPRGGPTVGSGREYAPASTRQEIHISADRKAALIEAGVWDDPVLRMKYAKRYAEYDRNNKQ